VLKRGGAETLQSYADHTMTGKPLPRVGIESCTPSLRLIPQHEIRGEAPLFHHLWEGVLPWSPISFSQGERPSPSALHNGRPPHTGCPRVRAAIAPIVAD